MQTPQTLALAISVCALLVSLYSAYERRVEIRKAQRIRLAQIADALSELQIAADAAEGDLSGYNMRRELLAQQAASLTGASKKVKLSSIEARTIALACRMFGDEESARSFFETSIASASREGRTYQVYALRSYADFLFSLGEISTGRDLFRRAQEMDRVRLDGSSKVRLLQTFEFWAVAEATTRGGDSDAARHLLAQAEQLAAELPSTVEAKDALQLVAEHRELAFEALSEDGSAQGQRSTVELHGSCREAGQPARHLRERDVAVEP